MYAHIFVFSSKGSVYIVPLNSRKEFPKALQLFTKEVGVPGTVITDSRGCNTTQEVKQFCNKFGATMRILEKPTEWANRAALYVELSKKAV
jgi:hypothetical protein